MEKEEEKQKDKREKSVAASSVPGLECRGETHKRLRLHFVSPPSEGGASIFLLHVWTELLLKEEQQVRDTRKKKMENGGK